jgi:flagellar hook-associated protein 2
MATNISSSSSLSTPTFSAGGLASGLDTNSIIDKLVTLESRPITALQTAQAGLKTQISQLGSIVSKLTALKDATDGLAKDGALAVTAASTTTSFSASPGSSAVAGRYTVQVQTLARAAKVRSAGFLETDTVSSGTLQLSVAGVSYGPISVAPGSSLGDLADQIRASGAPVTVAVLNDGTRSYLSVTARDTGFASGLIADDALAMSFTGNGDGVDPAFATIQQAQNATFTVDGLSFTRTSNTVADAIPGTTLSLKSQGGAAEELVLSDDPTGTQQKLQKFVDAYNDVMKLVQSQLAVTKDTDRSATLAGDAAVRDLQSQLQRLTATMVGSGSIRSLADLGVRTARDGTLSIDASTLQRAMATDASAVNALFSTASTGLGAVVSGLVDRETRSGDGVLTLDQKRLDDGVSSLDDQIASSQRRVDAYRQALVAQFTAMEQTVSALKASGNYLSQLSAASSTSSK